MKLTFGITVMLIGLATVFVGLILLIVIIKLISIFMQGIAANKANKPAPVVQAPVAEPEIVEEPEDAEDPNIPFVIAAAIAACEDDSKKFVVRRVRRVSNSWSDNARREQILNY